MCGRYSLTSPGEVMAEVFGLAAVPEIQPRYNIAPTQPAPIVRAEADGQRFVASLRWGLVPAWAADRKLGNRLINARQESLTERAAFRDALEDRRCLVPADGYYEWQASPEGKIPYLVRSLDSSLLAFAGLWETWRDGHGGQLVETFTIVTCAAPEPLRVLHGRMPAILPAAAWAAWLDPGEHTPEELLALIQPDAARLAVVRVGPLVNSVHNEGAGCWSPPVAQPPAAQMELFF